MFSLKAKIELMFTCIIVLLIYLSDYVFFWGKYLGLLLILGVSAACVMLSIVEPTKLIINQKKERSTLLIKTWITLRDEKKREKKIILITCIISFGIFAFGIWLGNNIYKDIRIMNKDIHFVLNKNYAKVEGIIESSEFSRQRGSQHIQYITVLNKLDNKYIYINFEHKYEKIYEHSKYEIGYLPNTKLGVYAKKII